MSFNLDERLINDSTFVAEIGICQVRINHDSRYRWLILIPQIKDVSELDDLSFEQQVDVLKASNILSSILKSVFKPDKLNIAVLGNIVKQLHIHHVARFKYDAAWPWPIWGHGSPAPYIDCEIDTLVKQLRSLIYDYTKEND